MIMTVAGILMLMVWSSVRNDICMVYIIYMVTEHWLGFLKMLTINFMKFENIRLRHICLYTVAIEIRPEFSCKICWQLDKEILDYYFKNSSTIFGQQCRH